MKLKRLEPDDERPAFTCLDPDLDEFYLKDSIEGSRQLLSVTYAFIDDDSNRVVAFFSVSNDSIKKEQVPPSAFKRLVKLIPFSKRYSSMPAAKIGRLGVASDQQRHSHGTMVLDFLKVWFTHGNKTGCRFLLVDAYNDEKTRNFYIKNGFQFLTKDDESEQTRIMYFDMITFRP